MHKNLKYLIYILAVLIFTGPLFAQDKVIIISERVGEEINTREREKYNLFQDFENFKSAIYYQGEDRKFFVKIKQGKSTKDYIIYLSKDQLFNAALNIEYYEDIKEGIYPRGQKFSLDTLGDKYAVRISNAYRDVLPFVKQGSKPDDYPSVGFGLSLSYLSVDLAPVEAFFKQAEETLSKNGFVVPENKMDFKPTSMFSFSLYLRIYKTFGIEVETGTSLNSDADFWYTGAFLQYHFPLSKPRWLRPFVAAGVGKHSYSIGKLYEIKIDPSGATLQSISSHGDQLGYFLKAGFEVGDTYYGGLNVFGSYSYIPDISTVNQFQYYSYRTVVKLGGLQFGAGLRIYF